EPLRDGRQVGADALALLAVLVALDAGGLLEHLPPAGRVALAAGRVPLQEGQQIVELVLRLGWLRRPQVGQSRLLRERLSKPAAPRRQLLGRVALVGPEAAAVAPVAQQIYRPPPAP